MAKKRTTKERKKSGALMGGLLLIGLGIYALLDQMFPELSLGDFWPFALIVPGVIMVVHHYRR